MKTWILVIVTGLMLYHFLPPITNDVNFIHMLLMGVVH